MTLIDLHDFHQIGGVVGSKSNGLGYIAEMKALSHLSIFFENKKRLIAFCML